MEHTTIAVDVASSVFEVAVSTQPGRVTERLRLTRARFAKFLGERSPATVVLEACGSSHHWARRAQAAGHTAVLLPPHAVKPYVVRDKTDRADAKGLLEAFRNEDVRPVPVKSESQQAITALHRLRSAWLAERTARLNIIRGALREFGVIIPSGAHQVVPHLLAALEDADSGVPDVLRPALAEAASEIRDFERRMKAVEVQLEAVSRQTPAVTRLRTIPGIGLLSSTALVASVTDIRRFPTSRHFASYLGLTPRENSSGLKRRLGAISKRGDTYLRMLLIHGARTVLWHGKRLQEPDRLRTWALRLERERGHNRAAVATANKLARLAWAVAVATANKLARLAWAVWKNGHDFREGLQPNDTTAIA